jgi:hypothetical protein
LRSVLGQFGACGLFEVDAGMFGDQQQVDQDVGTFVAQGFLRLRCWPTSFAISASLFHCVSSSSSLASRFSETIRLRRCGTAPSYALVAKGEHLRGEISASRLIGIRQKSVPGCASASGMPVACARLREVPSSSGRRRDRAVVRGTGSVPSRSPGRR